MAKYTAQFKQQVVAFYLENHRSYTSTAQHFHIPSRNVERWVARFQRLGEAGLARARTTRTYSVEQKLEIIQFVFVTHSSLEQTALHFGLSSTSMISRWLQAFEKQGINGLHPKPKGRQPMKPKYPKMPPKPTNRLEELELENLRLRAENAYLKKLREFRLKDEQERQKLSKHCD